MSDLYPPLPPFPTAPPVEPPPTVVDEPERPARARGRPALVGGLAGAVVGALVATGALVAFDDDPPDRPSAAAPSGPSETFAEGERFDVAGVLDKVQASVVSIEINEDRTISLFSGAGSGVVISDDGLVLTNAHVVEGARSITVIQSDGSEQSAELVGSFEADDVALVRLANPDGVVPADLGTSSDLQVGDEVLAIGNALNLGGTPSVTQGIVSAINRTVEAPGVAFEGLIQTDAAINRGNSGGPLVNNRGQVVGLNTAIIDDAQNIGFAIPIDTVEPLIDDIREGRAEVTPDTAFLGVRTNDVSGVLPDVLERYDVTATSGAFVVEVTAGSAAEGAGLEVGDVIVAIDGDPIESSAEVRQLVRAKHPGDEVELTVERGGDERSLTAVLGALGD